MDKLKLSGKHIILLFLYSPTEGNDINVPIPGRTRIVKMMFIFKQEVKQDFLNNNIKEIELPDFIPYDYGPYAVDVYKDLEFLLNNGFINDIITNEELSEAELEEYSEQIEEYALEGEGGYIESDRTQYNYTLTEKGRKFTEEKIWNKLTTEQKDLIIRFKTNINNSSLYSILRYVYLQYPEMTRKSKIKEEVVG
ncbi:MAG: hypothetical protein ACLFSQ_04220 [Candidatus Zixiibacteriota bacterium]